MKIKPGNATTGLPGSSHSYASSLIPDDPPDPSLNLTPAQRAQAAQTSAPAIPSANRLIPRARGLFFDPPPEVANKIFESFFDPCFSLASVASEHNTTLEALTAWMARDDIAERMDNFTGALAARLRMVTVARLHHAVDACTIILQEYKDAACHEAGIREGRACSAGEHNRRDRESARKTSILMLRFAQFDPLARRTRARAGAANTHRGQIHVISPNSTTITLSNPYAAPAPSSSDFSSSPSISFPDVSPSPSSSSPSAPASQPAPAQPLPTHAPHAREAGDTRAATTAQPAPSPTNPSATTPPAGASSAPARQAGDTPAARAAPHGKQHPRSSKPAERPTPADIHSPAPPTPPHPP